MFAFIMVEHECENPIIKPSKRLFTHIKKLVNFSPGIFPEIAYKFLNKYIPIASSPYGN